MFTQGLLLTITLSEVSKLQVQQLHISSGFSISGELGGCTRRMTGHTCIPLFGCNIWKLANTAPKKELRIGGGAGSWRAQTGEMTSVWQLFSFPLSWSDTFLHRNWNGMELPVAACWPGNEAVWFCRERTGAVIAGVVISVIRVCVGTPAGEHWRRLVTLIV